MRITDWSSDVSSDLARSITERARQGHCTATAYLHSPHEVMYHVRSTRRRFPRNPMQDLPKQSPPPLQRHRLPRCPCLDGVRMLWDGGRLDPRPHRDTNSGG